MQVKSKKSAAHAAQAATAPAAAAVAAAAAAVSSLFQRQTACYTVAQLAQRISGSCSLADIC